jgi:hypothetical protein
MMLFERKVVSGDFSGRVGKTFEVHVQGHKIPLLLDAYQELPASKRDGGAFRLEFIGPTNPALGQGAFPFLFGEDEFAIFIVPLGQDARGMRYEAIYY